MVLIYGRLAESGLMYLFRKQTWPKNHRGFESLTYRHFMTHEAERHQIAHRLEALLGSPEKAKELVWLIDFHSESMVIETLRQYAKRDSSKRHLTTDSTSGNLPL